MTSKDNQPDFISNNVKAPTHLANPDEFKCKTTRILEV
jgi:hypothetical protein